MLPSSPIVAWLLTYRYHIAYPLGIVEGPVVMMIAGLLVRLGLFDFWPIYLILIAGDLTGNIIWYSIGRHGARPLINRFGHFINLDEAGVERAEKMFAEHQTKILFISKITMGFGFALATLIAAGAAHVNFKKYMTINFFGEFIWAGILFAVGYFLGDLYVLVDRSLRWAFIGAMIVIGFAAMYGFAKFMRSRFNDK